MNADIAVMLDLMERSFRDFESSCPSKPKPKELSFGMAYRFEEQDIYQAMLLKLARVLSVTRAALLLCERGFIQEQGILCRTLDETNEDIVFLAYAVTNGEITDLHQRFLAAFWEEEIDDSGSMLASAQKRPMIPRQKIQAYIANIEDVALDPSSRQNVSRTIQKAYSGYVHGAAPHIMDLYYGDPPTFHTAGMRCTERHFDSIQDVWNYVYRSYLSFCFVAKALGAATHVEILIRKLKEIEKNAGM